MEDAEFPAKCCKQNVNYVLELSLSSTLSEVFLVVLIIHYLFFHFSSNEAIVQSGMVSSKNSQEMESHVFQKSQTKDEYLSYVARLILHVREMSKLFMSERFE